MKICLILQRNFAYIGHAIAINLKNKYGINNFCGYVSLRLGYDFLKNQNEIKYSALLLDEEIHEKFENEKIDLNFLNSLEKEYGIPDLWPFIAVDRMIMSNQLIREYPYDKSDYTHEEMLKLLQVHAKAAIELLDKEKPDVLIASVVGSLGSSLIYYMAKKRGIKVKIILPAGTEANYQTISETYDRFTYAENFLKQEIIQPEKSKEAIEYLKNFRNKPKSYADHIGPMLKQTNRFFHFKFLSPKNFYKFLLAFFTNLLFYLKNYKSLDYSYSGHPWYFLVDRIKRKTRNLIGVSDLYDDFTPAEDFAFFPLHFEPEIALSMHAPFFSDQIHLIKQIAKSLPVYYKLYVKEHPAMVEYRPRRYYKELKKIPNVKIINPSISSYEIIPQAKLITTITGTVGWEGVLLKKPVISFGHQFYNSLSMVTKCSEIEKLPYLVNDLLKNFKYDEAELLNFLTGIYATSVKVNLSNLWYDEDDINIKIKGVEPLADLIAKQLKL